MVLLLFATQACTDIFLPGLPQIAAEFHSSIDVASRTVSVYNIVQAIVVLVIGVVSDVRGRRPTMLLCFGLHILATIVIAVCNSMGLMIAMRAVQALGSAAVYIVLRMIIKDTLDKKAQIHATGLLVIGLVLSPILAPVVGSWIVHWSSWRNCFWLLALIDLPLFIWACMVVGETNLRRDEMKASFSWSAHAGNYASVLRDRYFGGMALIVGAGFAAFYAFISISSFMFIEQFHMHETTYGYVFIGMALFYLTGNRMMSTLNARAWHPQRIIKLGLVVSLAGGACILAAPLMTAEMFIVSLIAFGTLLLRMSTALVIPPAQVEMTNHFPESAANALGLLTSIQYCFAAIGTTLVSSLPFMPSTNFLISTVVFVLLSSAGFAIFRKRRAAIR